MVEEMKYISITGPIDNINHVIEHHLTRYDIQLENAAKQLNFSEGLQPFNGVNPYVEAYSKAEKLLTLLNVASKQRFGLAGGRAVEMVNAAYQVYEKRDFTLKELVFRRDAINKYLDTLRHFVSLDFRLDKLDSFTHILCNFGRLPVGNFKQFEKFLYDDSEIIFMQSDKDNDHIWGVYFTPMSKRDKVNSIFSSLHFERLPVLNAMPEGRRTGNPVQIAHYYQELLNEISKNIHAVTESTFTEVAANPEEIIEACYTVKELYNMHEIKKYAAVTQVERSSANAADSSVETDSTGLSKTYYYLFVGWMAQKDALALESEMNDDELTFFSRSGETSENALSDNPPTRLKNLPVIRLFEFFTRMYGIPLYGEIDPTPVMAVVYTLLFGMMFGDVGQGLCIAALGLFVYKKFKTDLGGIMAVAGVSGMVFGFLYGSIFGIEDLLPALWRRPAEDITGMLIFAVGVGVCIIFLSMALNIVNNIRSRQWGTLFFDPNGITGIMFYALILLNVVRVMLYGYTLTGLDIALTCLPLVFVAFREPLIKFMEGEHKLIEGGIGMFLFGTILELVEVLLSYMTNTISFVRVGAFAVSHAFIMSVVLQLSRTAAGTHNPLVLVLGNIVVMGIEGLLVGIQVLRLDFYEVFSRFYNGSGESFKTYRAKN